MREGATARSGRAAVGVILLVAVATGPLGVVDITGETTALGEGTATVTVLEPSEKRVPITAGRFGTDVSYVRMPDLLVDVGDVSGQPRLLYTVQIPALDIDAENRRLIESPGRMRVPLRDRALARDVSGTYEGRVVVRVQSFSGIQTVANRSIEVAVR